MDPQTKAALILLERGVKFRMTDAPFYLRILGLGSMRIRPLTAGAILEMHMVMQAFNLELALLDNVHSKSNIKAIGRCLAIALLNNKLKIRLFSRALAYILVNSLSFATLIQIFDHLCKINSVADFMNITNWIRVQTTMLLSPRVGQ